MYTHTHISLFSTSAHLKSMYTHISLFSTRYIMPLTSEKHVHTHTHISLFSTSVHNVVNIWKACMHTYNISSCLQWLQLISVNVLNCPLFFFSILAIFICCFAPQLKLETFTGRAGWDFVCTTTLLLQIRKDKCIFMNWVYWMFGGFLNHRSSCVTVTVSGNHVLSCRIWLWCCYVQLFASDSCCCFYAFEFVVDVYNVFVKHQDLRGDRKLYKPPSPLLPP